MASDCATCGGQGDITCPGEAGRGCGPGEDAYGGTCTICSGVARVGCPDCEDLPPGPTWDEALRLIRRHDRKTADWLDHQHYLGLRAGVPRRALAELESEALDLYERYSVSSAG